jgi:hypothetical protein
MTALSTFLDRGAKTAELKHLLSALRRNGGAQRHMLDAVKGCATMAAT